MLALLLINAVMDHAKQDIVWIKLQNNVEILAQQIAHAQLG
jgi:hypothetical protein